MPKSPPSPALYLDYNATAPLLPTVREVLCRSLDEVLGNASSAHRWGQAARQALEQARRSVARSIGCHASEVIFTSGGSEANATVLHSLIARYRQGKPAALILSAVEHPSLSVAQKWLAKEGIPWHVLPVDTEGQVLLEALETLLRREASAPAAARIGLVSVMAANNETGVLQPLHEISALVRRYAPEALIHSDAAQYPGRLPLAVGSWDLDCLTLTTHKCGGPKGIGALVLRRNLPTGNLFPLIRGGSQEQGLRAGTEAVFLAMGFAAALEWADSVMPAEAERLEGLTRRLLHQLEAPELFVNVSTAPRLPNTLSFGFEGVEATALLIAADLVGVAFSAGSACASGALTPSPVLQAMGLPPARLRSSVRASIGHATTPEAIDEAAARILKARPGHRSLHPASP